MNVIYINALNIIIVLLKDYIHHTEFYKTFKLASISHIKYADKSYYHIKRRYIYLSITVAVL